MFCVIEYLAKSLEVTQDHLKGRVYVSVCRTISDNLTYSASKNGVTLKCGLEVHEGH